MELLARYVTGIRLFFMVPGILVITLGLLVNCLPSWRGLAEYFLGVIFLFSAPWRKEKIAFRQSYGRGGKKGIGGQLISIAMVFLLGESLLSVRPDYWEKRPKRYQSIPSSLLSFSSS